MSRGTQSGAAEAPRRVRCAIYTRKSTSEGLDSDFNTLDAQREAAELYIRSQASQGWVVLPDRYDDGGFTGANIERPALQRLLADIEAGEVDCVVVYKVDRLSRSLLDFAQFEREMIADRTRAGREVGGGAWTEKDVHMLLRNPLYLGKVDFKGERYEGEHEAIVSEELFARVQSMLSSKACGPFDAASNDAPEAATEEASA